MNSYFLRFTKRELIAYFIVWERIYRQTHTKIISGLEIIIFLFFLQTKKFICRKKKIKQKIHLHSEQLNSGKWLKRKGPQIEYDMKICNIFVLYNKFLNIK